MFNLFIYNILIKDYLIDINPLYLPINDKAYLKEILYYIMMILCVFVNKK